MSFEYTSFHEAIKKALLANPNKNYGIDAGPGSGKTTTIFEIIVPALYACYQIGIRLFAFNRKNADDFKVRLDKYPTCSASTIHATMLEIIRSNWGPKVKVNAPQEAGYKFKKYQAARDGKTKEAAKELFPEANGFTIANVCQLVTLAKSNAFGIITPVNDRAAWEEIKARHSIGVEETTEDNEDIIAMAIKVFAATVEDKSQIDFDDMPYFVAKYNLKLPDWDALVLDEGQDVTPIALHFMKRMKDKGCRIIFVGDRKQAINSFMGAMHNSIDEMAAVLDAEVLPLPVSYRCSLAAAQLANQVFPNSVVPNKEALLGSVETISFEEFTALAPNMGVNDVMLSRTHKNLLPFAFAYIKQNMPFRYKGIKPTAVKMLQSLYHGGKVSKDLYKVRQSLREYQNELEDKYNGGKKLPNWVIENGENLCCLCDLIGSVELESGDYKTVRNYLQKLAASDEEVHDGPTLSTIHASKGGQWSNVYLCGELRSSLAVTEQELAAEQCLEFVAYTRSSDKIIRVGEPAQKFN